MLELLVLQAFHMFAQSCLITARSSAAPVPVELSDCCLKKLLVMVRKFYTAAARQGICQMTQADARMETGTSARVILMDGLQ
jgi:hypothetical protein